MCYDKPRQIHAVQTSLTRSLNGKTEKVHCYPLVVLSVRITCYHFLNLIFLVDYKN